MKITYIFEKTFNYTEKNSYYPFDFVKMVCIENVGYQIK